MSSFSAFLMRILGSTSHNINFWNGGEMFSQFSVVLDQYSRDKKKKKTQQNPKTFIIEPFWKQRPAAEERDNSAKYG